MGWTRLRLHQLNRRTFFFQTEYQSRNSIVPVVDQSPRGFPSWGPRARQTFYNHIQATIFRLLYQIWPHLGTQNYTCIKPNEIRWVVGTNSRDSLSWQVGKKERFSTGGVFLFYRCLAAGAWYRRDRYWHGFNQHLFIKDRHLDNWDMNDMLRRITNRKKRS